MTTKTDTKKRRASDAELRTMSKILGLLAELDPEARARVMAYVNERQPTENKAGES